MPDLKSGYDERISRTLDPALHQQLDLLGLTMEDLSGVINYDDEIVDFNEESVRAGNFQPTFHTCNHIYNLDYVTGSVERLNLSDESTSSFVVVQQQPVSSCQKPCATVEGQKPRPKTRAYTVDEWHFIRPIFTKLYAENDKTLDDIMRTMSDVHDFHPTRAMYKARIKEWGIFRNVKAAEKDKIIDALQDTERTLEVSQTLARKSLRHAKKVRRAASTPIKRLQASLGYKVPQKMRSDTCQTQKFRQPSVQVAGLKMMGTFSGNELVLHLVQDTFTSLPVSRDCNEHLNCDGHSGGLHRHLAWGQQQLRVKAFGQARDNFREAGRLMTQVICTINQESLIVIMPWLAVETWTQSAAERSFRKLLLAFVSRSVLEQLGPHHSLFRLIAHINQQGESFDEQPNIYQLILNVRQSTGATPKNGGIGLATSACVNAMANRKQYHSIIEFCKNHEDFRTVATENTTDLGLSLYRSYAGAQYSLGCHTEAECTLLTGYERASNCQNVYWMLAMAENLALHFREQQNFETSLWWFQAALKISPWDLPIFSMAFDVCRQHQVWSTVVEFLVQTRKSYELMLRTTDEPDCYCLGCLKKTFEHDTHWSVCGTHPSFNLKEL